MLDLMNSLTLLIALMLVLMLLIAAGFVIAVYIARKKAGRENDREENREGATVIDSRELLPIEDIKNDMIIEKGGKRFSAVISCQGNEFYTAGRDEKIAIQNNYIDFIAALGEPISYRQYSEGVNLDYTLQKYSDVHKKLETEIYNLTEDYRLLYQDFQNRKDMDSPQTRMVADKLIQMKGQIDCYNWRISHVESQIRYLDRVAGTSFFDRTYVVSWQQEGGAISEELSGDALMKKAAAELDKLCRVKIRQLTDAGATARRCKTIELIEMCRRHCNPISADRYRMEQVMDSSYFTDINTTDSVERANREFDEDVVERLVYGEGERT